MLSEISLKSCIQSVLKSRAVFLEEVLLLASCIWNIWVTIVQFFTSFAPRLSLWGSQPQVKIGFVLGLEAECCAVWWKGGGKGHGFCTTVVPSACISQVLPSPACLPLWIQGRDETSW